ncbi:hypothetical protein KBTX_02420 [wastewater metagenome]|uniref:Uncharacterized protein n=2 Tax=unclassified sequences TaxID=12908 RepID=A0A5B8RBS8_9ZZZZ|nr:hypothetical protein [Arhodomonas aquaeolei]MCS4505426.1 hypothetical protein [Arhodomonas aquaeolei]QEA06091.1 hypothetical protein KBTEX_02420 [uncultured organism]
MIQLDREMTDLAMRLRRGLRDHGLSVPRLSDEDLVPTLLELAASVDDPGLQELAAGLDARLPAEEPEAADGEHTVRRYRGVALAGEVAASSPAAGEGESPGRGAIVYRGRRIR